MRLKHWFYIIPLRLRSLFRRRQVEQELDEELQYHIERQIEENIAKGMTPEEARYAAHRAIGGVERRKEERRFGSKLRLLTASGPVLCAHITINVHIPTIITRDSVATPRIVMDLI